MEFVANIDQLVESLVKNPQARVCGGATKNALSGTADLNLSKMSGVIAYEPSEYTFTALAGTKLSEIATQLASEGQAMPFDPPLVQQGATIGGTVAAGLSGSGRFRYGGIRDFFLGVKLVTRNGRVVFGGGKVVKNAAGFDLPKLMVGALGQFGVMTELTFKVFPQPKHFVTLVANVNSAATGVSLLQRLAAQPLDLNCLDFVAKGLAGQVVLRFGGLSQESLRKRADGIRKLVAGSCNFVEDENQYWRNANDFTWCNDESMLIKVPLLPRQIPTLEALLNSSTFECARRYTVGGNLCWLSWPADVPLDTLQNHLKANELRGLIVRGDCRSPLLNEPATNPFHESLLSPFVELAPAVEA